VSLRSRQLSVNGGVSADEQPVAGEVATSCEIIPMFPQTSVEAPARFLSHDPLRLTQSAT
jgi:hypothetical protein